MQNHLLAAIILTVLAILPGTRSEESEKFSLNDGTVVTLTPAELAQRLTPAHEPLQKSSGFTGGRLQARQLSGPQIFARQYCFSPTGVYCNGGCCGDDQWCYAGGCCMRTLKGCGNRTCLDDTKYQCCLGGFGCELNRDCCINGCCDPGYMCCGAEGCCKKGGECCIGGGCCDPGSRCMRNLRTGYRFCDDGSGFGGSVGGSDDTGGGSGSGGSNPGSGNSNKGNDEEPTTTPTRTPSTTPVPTPRPTQVPKCDGIDRECSDSEDDWCCPWNGYCYKDRLGKPLCATRSTIIFSYYFSWRYEVTVTRWFVTSTTYYLPTFSVQAITTPPPPSTPPPESLAIPSPTDLDAENCGSVCEDIGTPADSDSNFNQTNINDNDDDSGSSGGDRVSEASESLFGPGLSSILLGFIGAGIVSLAAAL